MPDPVDLPIWHELETQAEVLSGKHIRDFFAADPDRFNHFSRRFGQLLLDFSKNRIQRQTLDLLLELARQAEVPAAIEALFTGAELNTTEQRAALHTALRHPTIKSLQIDGQDIIPAIHQVLDQMRLFARKVRNQTLLGYTGKPINTIVAIGIGGSDLGPRLVCQALRPYGDLRLKMHFMSSVDGSHVHPILTTCDPETTLFIVSSKTFTTSETMTNASTARDWLLTALGSDTAIARHFVAVTANRRLAEAFGIESSHIFEFWDWVCGRYSVWSAIGLPIAIYIGYERYLELLAGAHAMDKHFRTADLVDNLPVLLALVGVWNRNFQGIDSQAILIYDDYLRALPKYLQQLEMESNGKSITRDGQAVRWDTAPVIWGGLGNNGQHAYYQLLHQGPRLVAADFLAPVETPDPLGRHHAILVANCLAQSAALMQGKTEQQVRAELSEQGLSDDELEQVLPYRVFVGNRPSNTLLYRQLTPHTLGCLLALYEHKVFVQGWIWNINSFDQWGEELGKEIAKALLPEVQGRKPIGEHDSSTQGLLQFCRDA